MTKGFTPSAVRSKLPFSGHSLRTPLQDGRWKSEGALLALLSNLRFRRPRPASWAVAPFLKGRLVVAASGKPHRVTVSIRLSRESRSSSEAAVARPFVKTWQIGSSHGFSI